MTKNKELLKAAQVRWKAKSESKAKMKGYQHEYYMKFKKFKKDETKA